MFKFNFQTSNDEETEPENVKFSSETEEDKINEASEAKVEGPHEERANTYRESQSQLTVGETSLFHANLQQAEEIIANLEESSAKNVTRALEENSDVISGIYEGGLKIWECTLDLLNYLEKEKIDFSGKSVLDLGCGAGLLGIYALKKGALKVDFQDYNKEVLDYVTIPNVLLNEHSKNAESKFVGGDWRSASTFLANYDFVLTSETIYNTEYYSKLLNVLEDHLAADGTIFIAAKSCYFGVGGSVHLFQQAVAQREKFACETRFVNEDGVRREILRLTRTKN